MKYSHGRNRQFFQIFTILTGSLAGVNSGLMQTWTSPSIPKIIVEYPITLEEASYLAVLPQVTIIFVAYLFPLLANKLGRKRTIVLSSVPHVLNWIVVATSYNIWLFYASRIVSGIADSATYTILPIYFGEIAEPSVRGTWGSMLTVSFVIGRFVVNVVGSYASITTTAWICAAFPLLYGALSLLLPESPYYLLMKGEDEKARNTLKKLRWRNDVDEELQTMKNDVARQLSETGTLKDLFAITSNRRALFIGIGARMAQAYTGLVAFDAYTQYMFQKAGSVLPEKIAAIIYSAISIPCIILSSSLVDKFGRRPLMISSLLGCAIFLTVESIYFCLKQFTQVDLSSFVWVPVVAMYGFTIVSASGIGYLATLMVGELFSTSIKAKATSILIASQSIHFFIVPKLFQLLTHNFGIYAPFIFFTCCTYVSTVLVYLYVIETKQRTLEQIQQVLKGNKNSII